MNEYEEYVLNEIALEYAKVFAPSGAEAACDLQVVFLCSGFLYRCGGEGVGVATYDTLTDRETRASSDEGESLCYG